MPLYLEIAVVATNESSFGAIQGIPALSRTGIAPRYKFVALDRLKDRDIIQIDYLEHRNIGLWVTFDDRAMVKCQEVFAGLASTPHYSRGFYDHHLPTAVVQVKTRDEFSALTETIFEAFCATS